MANCPGLHSAEEPWHPTEAEKIFELSQAYGVPIEAVEFANEPNMLEDTGFPKGYTAAHYRRDQDLFFQFQLVEMISLSEIQIIKVVLVVLSR